MLFAIFLLAIYLWTIACNTGAEVSPNMILPIGFGILFFYAGILCENAKRNWFVGIRTPWTLSSAKVWEKTHKIGGKLFKVAGVLAAAGLLFRNHAFLFIIVPALAFVIHTIVFSYLEYQKEAKQLHR